MQTFINFLDSFSSFIVALGLIVNLYFTHRSMNKIDRVQATAEITHLAVNSKMDKLLAVTGESEKAKGVLQERDRMKTETKEG